MRYRIPTSKREPTTLRDTRDTRRTVAQSRNIKAQDGLLVRATSAGIALAARKVKPTRFLGTIVDDPAYADDERYRIKEQFVANTDGDSPFDKVTFKDRLAADVRYVVATNLAEVLTHAHGVAVGTVVQCFGFRDVSDRRLLRWVFSSETGAALQQFRVRAFGADGDTLLCRTWDGAVEGDTDVKVLLPHELRKSRYDGKQEALFDATSGSYVVVRYEAGPTPLTRTAFIDAESYEEEQIITPQYVPSAHGLTIGPTVVIAIAAAAVVGGLGQRPDTPENERASYMVVDARAWAEVFTEESAELIIRRMSARRSGGERA